MFASMFDTLYNNPLTEPVLTFLTLAPAVMMVAFSLYQTVHRTLAVKRFRQAVPRNVTEEDLGRMLDVLRKLEQDDELRNVDAVIQRMRLEKDNSALAYAFTRLDPVSQRFMADMVADPSDATRRRFLKHAAEAA